MKNSKGHFQQHPKFHSTAAVSLALAFLVVPFAGNVAADTFVAIEDATISEALADTNFGSTATLVSSRDDFLREAAALIKFDLSSIPAASTINSARLEMFLRSSDGTPPVALNVWDVVSGWSEGTVTWNTPRTWNCCFGSTNVGPIGGGIISWDVKSLVESWTAEPALTRIRSLAVRGTNVVHERTFDSREGTNAPRLVIDFTPPPPDGKIVVTITEAFALHGHDDTIAGTQADLYLKVRVNNGPLVVSRIIDGRDHASWSPPFSVTNDVLRSQRIYPVRVVLTEYDSTSPDNTFDINPGPQKIVDLEFDACTMTWRRVGIAEVFGPGPDQMPHEEDLHFLEDEPGKIVMNITTGDGRPFAPDDVLIANASPVQAAFDPNVVVADKATAFVVDLVSSWSVPRSAQVTVTMSDGATTNTDFKTVSVPTNGLRVFFFDGTGTNTPFTPTIVGTNRFLTYSVQMTVPGEGAGAPPWFNCLGENNSVFGRTIKIVPTRNPAVIYRRWDFDDNSNPPTVEEAQATFDANEPFRQAIFPIPVANGTLVMDPLFTEFGLLTPGILPDDAELEPAQTIALQGLGAEAAGIERLVLMARTNWFSENSSRLTFGDDAIGMSLAEAAPRAVIAEAGTSQTCVHEIGHTFWQSQHSCSTGGAAEEILNAGCRDEYTHAASDGSPYPANGFDVVGAVYSTTFGGTPGTREVRTINFMDTTGAPNGNYDRWIDTFSFNDLAEKRMRIGQDPQLITLSGVIWAKNGLSNANPNFTGFLLNSYECEGVPDFEPAPLGVRTGGGFFAIKIGTPQGERIYRFNPQFFSKPGKGDIACFSFTVVAEPTGTNITLVGPSDIHNENKNTDVPLLMRKRSNAAPKINTVRAGLDVAPQTAGPQPDPPAIPPGHEVVMAWSVTDSDNDPLRAIVLLRGPQTNNGYGGWLPYAIEVSGNQFRIPRKMMPSALGYYDARLLVSDGVNSAMYEQTKILVVVPPPVLRVFSQPGKLILRWPAPPPNYAVESSAALGPNAQWGAVPFNPTQVGNEMELQLPTTTFQQRFFRLRAQP